MMIDYVGDPDSKEGYGIHNAELLKQFEKNNVDGVVVGHLAETVERVRCSDETLSKIGVACVPVPAVAPPWDYSILYTTVESQTVHEGWIARAQQWNEIWVPSKFCKDVLGRTILKSKLIFVMPEGVDSKVWCPPLKKLGGGTGVKTVKFLYHGVWHWRKGVDTLLKIWNEFKDRKDCNLLIIARVPRKDNKESRDIIYTDIKKYCDVDENIKGLNIEVITDILSQSELVQYYQNSDVLIYPTRGEGWGLPVIQALSCGLLCLVPEVGGYREFADEKNCILINGRITDRVNDEISFYYDFHKGQRWFESKKGEYVYWMNKFLKNPELYVDYREMASISTLVGFGWHLAVGKILNRLRQIERGG